MLVLFYVENLRRFIVNSVEINDELFGRARLRGLKAGKKVQAVREALVSDGVISQAVSDEVLELLEYRNRIGHKVHELTVDIGSYSHLGPRESVTGVPIQAYDYTAAKRAKKLKTTIERGMCGKFGMVIGLGSLRFEAAERVYLSEIERLKKRVNKAIKRENVLITRIIRLSTPYRRS